MPAHHVPDVPLSTTDLKPSRGQIYLIARLLLQERNREFPRSWHDASIILDGLNRPNVDRRDDRRRVAERPPRRRFPSYCPRCGRELTLAEFEIGECWTCSTAPDAPDTIPHIPTRLTKEVNHYAIRS